MDHSAHKLRVAVTVLGNTEVEVFALALVVCDLGRCDASRVMQFNYLASIRIEPSKIGAAASAPGTTAFLFM